MKKNSLRILLALLFCGMITLASEDQNKTAQVEAKAAKSSGQWQGSLDPVYAIKVDKYPKFSTEMVLKNGKKIRFASVKAMLNFYYHPEKYPLYKVSSRREVRQMFVKDYLSGERIPLKNAWFVFGSRLMGPHGDDLIPLSSLNRAELFTKRYGGTKILSFKEVAAKGYGLIHYLDMM